MKRFNLYLGASASASLLAILIILAELSEPFKAILTTMFSHHWIGKAVVITLAFVVFGLLFRGKNRIGKFSDEKVAWYSVIGSLSVIFLFYLIEFFI